MAEIHRIGPCRSSEYGERVRLPDVHLWPIDSFSLTIRQSDSAEGIVVTTPAEEWTLFLHDMDQITLTNRRRKGIWSRLKDWALGDPG